MQFAIITHRMSAKSENHPMTYTFSDRIGFEFFLQDHHMGSGIGTGAKGVRYKDGTEIIALCQSYYLDAGIAAEHLPAIFLHEEVELHDDSPDAHFKATLAEYTYVWDTSGTEGLFDYHNRLSRLLGGDNTTRNSALQTILSKK